MKRRWISRGIRLGLFYFLLILILAREPLFGRISHASAQAPAPQDPIDQITINGSPVPPHDLEGQRVPVSLPGVLDLNPYQVNAFASGTQVSLPVPAYTWELGCSAVSAAMIAAYYDRTAFPSIYTGPANGGVAPMDNSAWPTWSDGSTTYPNNPLIASRIGVDGRSVRGTIEDYWVKSNSTVQDPYLANGWAQHTWGTAIGDYMKTSQSKYNNVDGSTHFYANPTGGPLTCAAMQASGIQDDGTLGRKQFYEARGYAVSDCYNQNIDTNGGGFSYAMYKSEIDAGNPVLLNLAGHSIVGLGYDTASSTVYIHDTWDKNSYAMPWGGSYMNMRMLSVSIVHINVPGLPASFTKSAPGNVVSSQTTNPTISWNPANGASSYEYCLDQTNDNACSNWVNVGTSTQKTLSGLTPGTTYYWQVRAVNANGVTYASNQTWWSFRTRSATGASLNQVFIPQVSR